MSDSAAKHADGYHIYHRLLKYAFAYWKVFVISIVGMVLVAGTDTAIAWT